MTNTLLDEVDVLGNRLLREHAGVKSGGRVRAHGNTGTVRQIFELKNEPPKKLGVSRIRAWIHWDDCTEQYVDIDKLEPV